MNLDRYKTKIIQQVRNIQDEKLLNEIDTILLNNRVVAFTTDANSLSKNQYINHIETIKTDNWLIENIHTIKHIPCTIIQGRYDVVCPVRSAWDLHRAWPETTLKIIPNAGHSAGEVGIRSALIEATEEFKSIG